MAEGERRVTGWLELYALYNPDVPLRAVMSLVGLAGATYGALVTPTWTHNLIGGQILAGVVAYPPESPVPALYLNPWSVLVQLAALGLRAGVSEWTLSLMFSAVQGALGTLALAWLSWVFSRRTWVAALVPAVALVAAAATPLWVGTSLRVFHGHLYPNTYPVGPSLYAPIGMFLGVVALSLAAVRRWPAALGLTATLPCVHIGLAVPFGLAIGVMAAKDWTAVVTQSPAIRRGLALGLLVTLLSGAGALMTRPLPPTTVDADAGITAVFAEQWDDHSRVVAPAELVPLLEMVLWLIVLRVGMRGRLAPMVPEGADRLVHAVSVVAAVATIYTVVAAFLPDLIPWGVRVALITRWLNLVSWVVFAGGLALLARVALEGHLPAIVALLVAVVLRVSGVTVGISIASQFEVVHAMAASDSWGRLIRTVGVVYPFVVCAGLWWSAGRPVLALWRGAVDRGVVMATLGVWAIAGWHHLSAEPRGRCADVVSTLRAGSGALLVGADLWDASWVQVRTRRPVVFDPMDMNIIPFTPAAMGRVSEVLRDVYEVDPLGGPRGPLDRAWPSFTMDRWQTLAQRYGASDVLVADTVSLPLAIRASGDGCIAYQLR